MLSDRDRKLAKKYGEFFKEDRLIEICDDEVIFSVSDLAAFLVERDQLAIKEKDDAE